MMPINGNTLAKYLVMVSQVIAWCTVSIMLLRRGLNQMHDITTTQQPSTSGTTEPTDGYGNATDADTAVGANTGHQEMIKSLDYNGTPAVVAGIIMISIAVIMLVISPVIMLIKMNEKRKQRILETELESPPKYEDVVESAPRYSSLFVFNNDGEMALLSENMHKENENIKTQLV